MDELEAIAFLPNRIREHTQRLSQRFLQERPENDGITDRGALPEIEVNSEEGLRQPDPEDFLF